MAVNTSGSTWSPTTSRAARTSTAATRSRSEEHTSELQSQSNLVCRLLLEKKTFQKAWRCRRTRSAAVSSTSFRCGRVYLRVQPVILRLSLRGNDREHFKYHRPGCTHNSLPPTGRPLDESRLARR